MSYFNENKNIVFLTSLTSLKRMLKMELFYSQPPQSLLGAKKVMFDAYIFGLLQISFRLKKLAVLTNGFDLSRACRHIDQIDRVKLGPTRSRLSLC